MSRALAPCRLGSTCSSQALPLTCLSCPLQLMEALKEQEEINFRLRQYMDKIILAILDHNPSILEIKH